MLNKKNIGIGGAILLIVIFSIGTPMYMNKDTSPIKQVVKKNKRIIYDENGFSQDGNLTHIKTKTIHNEAGYDFYGFDKEGFNRSAMRLRDITKQDLIKKAMIEKDVIKMALIRMVLMF